MTISRKNHITHLNCFLIPVMKYIKVLSVLAARLQIRLLYNFCDTPKVFKSLVQGQEISSKFTMKIRISLIVSDFLGQCQSAQIVDI